MCRHVGRAVPGPRPSTGGGFFCGARGRKQPHQHLKRRLLASRSPENSFLSGRTRARAAAGNQYLALVSFCQRAQLGFGTLCSRLFSSARGPRLTALSACAGAWPGLSPSCLVLPSQRSPRGLMAQAADDIELSSAGRSGQQVRVVTVRGQYKDTGAGESFMEGSTQEGRAPPPGPSVRPGAETAAPCNPPHRPSLPLGSGRPGQPHSRRTRLAGAAPLRNRGSRVPPLGSGHQVRCTWEYRPQPLPLRAEYTWVWGHGQAEGGQR